MATRRLNDPIEPMDLGNMRANGVRSLAVQARRVPSAAIDHFLIERSKPHL
jgi:hypothetical protein